MRNAWPWRQYIISDEAIQNPEQKKIQKIGETDNSFGTKSAYGRDRREKGETKDKKSEAQQNQKNKRHKADRRFTELKFG